jgi:glycosyltransferase involved in cell wall biosynthesis
LLNRVWQDERLRRELRERALTRRKDFSWDKTAEATAGVYLEATGG